MGDLSKNLSRSEFACNCGCGQNTVDIELVPAIQKAGDFFSKHASPVAVKITSGNRCTAHNSREKGSKNSQHLYGRAADHYLYIKATGKRIPAKLLYQYYTKIYPGKWGIGEYRSWVHIDTRSGKPWRKKL